MNILIYGLANSFGGVESIVCSIIKKLPEYVYVSLLLSKESECQYLNYIGKCRNIRIFYISSWGKSRMSFIKDIKDIVKKNKFDYFWYNACVMSNYDAIRIVKKYSSAKIITHSHGTSLEERNIIKKYILLLLHYINRRRFLHSVDYPCMCSKKSGEWFYGKSFLIKNIVYELHNGVSTDKFKFDEDIRYRYRQKFKIRKDDYVLLHVGRLTAVKNQKYIIDILYHLLKKNTNYKLIFVGDGELKKELELYVESKKLKDFVFFMGFRNDPEIFYSVADAFLLPSFHEGLPVSVIEAQSSGLTCYISDTITKEVDILGNVKFLSIKNDPFCWANLIHSNTNCKENRWKSFLSVREKQYDINDVCYSFIKYLVGNDK